MRQTRSLPQRFSQWTGDALPFMLPVMYFTARVSVPGLGVFSCIVPVEISLSRGDRCVCEFHPVHELGTVEELASQEAPPERTEGMGTVLRTATPEDRERVETNREVAEKAIEAFRKYAWEAHVPVRPVKAHFSLRRERLSLCYASEGPVDIRQVLGHLQRQFATRVEARAAGARDEAAALGGCGICGRSLCCSSWLRQFQPVHIDMARQQDMSLIPSAINGMCGCLKCCLRYEHEQYVEAADGVPPTGYWVDWDEGEGVVVARDLMARKVTVKSQGRFLTLPVSDLRRNRIRTPSGEPCPQGQERKKEGTHDEDPDA